jgi:hypothetical protein
MAVALNADRGNRSSAVRDGIGNREGGGKDAAGMEKV